MSGLSIISCVNTVVIDLGSRGPRGIPGADGEGISLSAGTQLATSGLLSFADSNGVSFGLNGNTLTASVDIPQSTHSHSEFSFANSNNVTFGKVGSIITAIASFPAQNIPPVAFSAANGSAEFQTIKFANSNGVSWSTGTQGVIASVNGLTTAAQSNHSHGSPTINLTNISGTTGSNSNGFTLSLSAQNSYHFANANGITFGTNASTVTASHNGLTTAAQSNHSHGNPLFALTGIQGTTQSNANGLTVSLSADRISFSNSNGISFGLNGNTLTASHNGITTGMQSQMTSAFMSTGERDNYFHTSNHTFLENTHIHGSVYMALTNLSATATSLSDGLTLSLSAPNPTGIGLSFGTDIRTDGNLVFSNSNGINWGVSGSTVTASIPATGHQHSTSAFFVLTNLSQTVSTNSDGFTAFLSAALPGGSILISASNASLSTNQFTFGNSNNVSFYISNNSIVASVGGAGAVAMSGSNTSTSGSTLSFGNSNNLSFYVTNGSMVGSYDGPSGAVAISGSNASSTFQTLQFGNSNGLSFYLTNGSLVGSYTDAGAGAGLSAVRIFAGTTDQYVSQLSFSNGSGVSFGINGSTITASHNGVTTAALSNHSHGNPTLYTTNLKATTASNSAGFTMSLSGPNDIKGVVAGTQTLSDGSLSFHNSNGITFGLYGSYRLTASHNGITTGALSNHSHGNPTLALTNLSGTTGSNSNGFTLSLAAAAGGGGGGVAISAGTATVSSGTLSFANSNGISFGISGQTITASGGGGGAAGGILSSIALGSQGNSASQTFNATSRDTCPLYLYPFTVSESIVANCMRLIEFCSVVTTNVSGTFHQGLRGGIYTFYTDYPSGFYLVTQSGGYGVMRRYFTYDSRAYATYDFPRYTFSTNTYTSQTGVFYTMSSANFNGNVYGSADMQNQFGTNGFRQLIVPLEISTFVPGSQYWLGIMQTNYREGGNANISNGIVGNVCDVHERIAYMGDFTSYHTSGTWEAMTGSNVGGLFKQNMPLMYSNTTLAGYEGSEMPNYLSNDLGFVMTQTIKPLMTLFLGQGSYF